MKPYLILILFVALALLFWPPDDHPPNAYA